MSHSQFHSTKPSHQVKCEALLKRKGGGLVALSISLDGVRKYSDENEFHWCKWRKALCEQQFMGQSCMKGAMHDPHCFDMPSIHGMWMIWLYGYLHCLDVSECCNHM